MSQPTPAARGLRPGAIAPALILPDSGGASVDLRGDAIAGNIIVLAFLADPERPEAQATLASLAERCGGLRERGALVFAATRAPAEANAAIARRMTLPFPLLADPAGAAFAAWAIGPGPAMPIAVIAPNHHIAALVDGPEALDGAAPLIEALAAAQKPRPATVPHPPVLIVPDVLERADCRHLLSVFALRGQTFVEPQHDAPPQRTDYKMRIPEYGRRDRIDHWIVEADTNALIDGRLRERLFPEIRRAFQYKVTRREAYRIARYEGERGGEVHGHRDNALPRVAHRRFAVSINLNVEDFSGGELGFPEFGGARYRPDTGAAIVFSCSLLHEAHHITAGRRFVLLAFLYGET